MTMTVTVRLLYQYIQVWKAESAIVTLHKGHPDGGVESHKQTMSSITGMLLHLLIILIQM